MKFVSLILFAALCAGITACGDQSPPPPPATSPTGSKPLSEADYGRPDLVPPEKKDCAIMGFLCK